MERVMAPNLEQSTEDNNSNGDEVEEEASAEEVNADLSDGKEEEVKENEDSLDQPQWDCSSSTQTTTRQKSQNSKVKLLVRSHAMREETSPPPDPERATLEPPTTSGRPSSRLRLKQQGSSQGSMDSNSPLTLSRDSSTEQPPTGDSSGVDLPAFLTETVNRTQKDRLLLLRIEGELQSLLKDTKRTQYKSPPMSSYQRMLVHRMSALYNMEHNVDSTGAQVVVVKTAHSKTPDLQLRDHIRDDVDFEPRKSILKRDTNSLDDPHTKASDNRQSRSLEEREDEYEKVRRRIFKQEQGGGQRDCSLGEGDELRSSQEDLRNSWATGTHAWSSTDSTDSRTYLLRPSPPHASSLRPGRLLKVESFESRDILRSNSMRQAVSKSYSFGGYSGGTNTSNITRGDSVVSTHSAGARLLTKQDSGTSSVASRLSPQSSGYKSIGSQRSDATLSATPSPTATPMLPQGPIQMPAHLQQHFSGPTLMWAVSNMESVPAGSLLINPQTGQPYLNSDGSVYRFDPNNPPKLLSAAEPPPQPPSIQVHTSYVYAPPPPPPPQPPPADYSHQQQVIYSYQAPYPTQHSHHAQETCVTELSSYLRSGMQLNDSNVASQATPPSNYVVTTPGWQQTQPVAPRPPLMPPQPPASTQQTVLLLQPQRPLTLFPHSGGNAEAGYFSPPQTMIPAPALPNNNSGPIFPAPPTIRPPVPPNEGVTFANSSGYYPPAPMTSMCSSLCFNSQNQWAGSNQQQQQQPQVVSASGQYPPASNASGQCMVPWVGGEQQGPMEPLQGADANPWNC